MAIVAKKGGLKKKVAKNAKKEQVKFTIDCTAPVNDGILDVKSFEKYLLDRIKVDGKICNLGERVKVNADDKNKKVVVNAEMPFSKRYLKYLSKKYLKKNQLRDYLRVIAPNKVSYELRYFSIDNNDNEE